MTRDGKSINSIWPIGIQSSTSGIQTSICAADHAVNLPALYFLCFESQSLVVLQSFPQMLWVKELRVLPVLLSRVTDTDLFIRGRDYMNTVFFLSSISIKLIQTHDRVSAVMQWWVSKTLWEEKGRRLSGIVSSGFLPADFLSCSWTIEFLNSQKVFIFIF